MAPEELYIYRALDMSCKVAVEGSRRAVESSRGAVVGSRGAVECRLSSNVTSPNVSIRLQTSRQFWDLLKKMTFGDVSSHSI